MFTGLIQALGTLQRIDSHTVQINWTADSSENSFQDLAIGDSVAVDGVCLTVVQLLAQGFRAAVSPETLNRTRLQATLDSIPVNLETSLRVGSKLGGHFVTGHVDGLGALEMSLPTENAWEMSFSILTPAIARYIVPKGSIAINGVSLTIAECNQTGDWFKVAVIPHTYHATNLHLLQPGQAVNLEGDILGKYVEKLLQFGKSDPETVSNSDRASLEAISPTFLSEHGYL